MDGHPATPCAPTPALDAPAEYSFRSPPRILIPKLCQSRDGWKAKAQSRNDEIKTLKVRVRGVSRSRDDWRQRAEEAQLQVSHLQEQLAAAQQRIATLEGEKNAAAVPLSPPPRGGQFSATVVRLALDLVLHASASLRGAAATLALVAQRLALACPTPCFSSIRGWLLRLGCYALRRPLPVRQDWVWLVDHTIQVEKRKLLIILGVPLAAVAFSRRCLSLADLHLIALVPMEHSTGAAVAVELDKAKGRTGAPRLVVADHGSDLKTGIATFQQQNRQTAYVHDVAHHGALVLQKQWENNPRWCAFFARLGRTRAQVQQTELAALAAPALRMKARFMNVGPLVRFATRVLRLLTRCDEKLRAKVEQKYGWLREYEGDLQEWGQQHEVVQRAVAFVRYHGLYPGAEEEARRQWLDIEWSAATEQVAEQMKAYVKQYGSLAREGETLVGSSEVLESCIGKLKRLQADQSASGVTGLALAVGAMVGQWTEADISQALDEVPQKEADSWVGRLLGKTVQWMRRHLFHLADQP